MRLARPHQWIKNLLVLVAPAAAGVLLHPNVLWHAIAAFGVFCVAASGTYCINHATDAPSDRLHPTKRFRPVAIGTVPVALAISVGAGLLATAIGSGWIDFGNRFGRGDGTLCRHQTLGTRWA